jgi:hypothetical protein
LSVPFHEFAHPRFLKLMSAALFERRARVRLCWLCFEFLIESAPEHAVRASADRHQAAGVKLLALRSQLLDAVKRRFDHVVASFS